MSVVKAINDYNKASSREENSFWIMLIQLGISYVLVNSKRDSNVKPHSSPLLGS